jgi:ABC-type glycerol-3-phosphate transport system permease component
MAAVLMAALPCIALFFVAQRYFVRGIVMSGIKG